MNKELQEKLKAKADIFKALAHPTRLFITERLAEKKQCVCELVEEIEADFSTVSKHLNILKKAGLVEAKKQGLKVFYTLKAPCVIHFITCIENIIKNDAKTKLKLLSQ